MSRDVSQSETNLVPVTRSVPEEGAIAIDVPDRADPPQFDILAFLHRALRGRYLVSILLGLITGGAAAFTVYRYIPATYRSEGLIQIYEELPEVGESSTDQNRPIAMFDTFMQSQKMLITSHRVMDSAILDPIWKQKGYQVPPDPEQYFAKNLMVDIKPHNEYIQISVKDPNPGLAATAVNAIMNAYTEIYENQDKALEQARIGALDDRRAQLESQIRDLNDRIRGVVAEFGTSRLDELQTASQLEVIKLKSAIEDVQLALAVAPASGTEDHSQASVATPHASTQAEAPLSVEQIAALDPTMSQKLDKLSQIKGDLARLASQGYGEQHRDVLAAKAALQQTQSEIDTYAERYRKFRAATSRNLGDPRTGPVLTAGKSRSTLEANLKSLKALLAEAQAAMLHIGNRQFELQQMQISLDSLQTELTQKKHRIEQLHEQGSIGGRLNLVASGVPPLSPEDRPKHFAMVAAAGMAGSLLPAGLFVLLSLGRRRLTDSHEVEGGSSALPHSLLGIVPELDEKSEDEQLASAAHAVHHMRVLLQSRQTSDSCRTYLVTSATAGEGKTSLTLSLGLSFAAARFRTLIIDCDLIGRGLSHALQADGFDGLNEAMAGGGLGRFLRRTRSGVCFLPAGNAGPTDACAISPDVLRSLLNEARESFDVILIDSGPILGSVEAAVAAQEVDSVLFTISRGQQRSVVDSAKSRLQTLGARFEGVIFNRAKPGDFSQSVYGSSAHSSRSGTPGPRVSLFQPETITRLGPLVGAVACGMHSGRN